MDPAQKEEEGHALMAEAEKLQSSSKSGGFFRSLFTSSASSPEETAETYVKAANAFKRAKSWTHAGKALEKAAETYAGISEMQYESASKYSDAGKAYKNVNPSKAIPCFEKAIEQYADSARFQQCARLQKELAELYEADSSSTLDYEKTITAYVSAADFYDMDDAKSNANTMRIKVAALHALAEHYGEAIQLYEQVAQDSLANNLLKYGAREHLLRAGLCRLCQGDVIGAERALETYANMDSSFPSSREGRFLTDIVAAVSEADEQAFTNHVFEYDSISKLDEWKTSILLKIKNQIKADAGEEDLT